MPGTFHLAASGELEGLALSRLVSRLGVDSTHPCTFAWDGRGSLSTEWTRWLSDWFSPVLAPAFAKVHRLAGEVRPTEIASIDRELDRSLGERERRSSLEAATAFLDGKSSMRGHREWARFAERVAAGDTPGHAATLFALQTALYHLPLASALAAYAWFELESGLPRDGYRERPGSADETLAAFSAAIPHVQVAIAENHGEFSDGAPSLRAI